MWPDHYWWTHMCFPVSNSAAKSILIHEFGHMSKYAPKVNSEKWNCYLKWYRQFWVFIIIASKEIFIRYTLTNTSSDVYSIWPHPTLQIPFSILLICVNLVGAWVLHCYFNLHFFLLINTYFSCELPSCSYSLVLL